MDDGGVHFIIAKSGEEIGTPFGNKMILDNDVSGAIFKENPNLIFLNEETGINRPTVAHELGHRQDFLNMGDFSNTFYDEILYDDLLNKNPVRKKREIG